MATTTKRGLMTGLGNGYFDFMETEETETEAPTYEGNTKSVPSLESVETELTYESSPVYLSNKLHSDLGKMTNATMTLNAAYLPEGFAEEATGAEKLGEGVYAFNTKPITKFFRFAFPMTDENGNEVIVNFPKCKLEPVGLNPSTETETKEAQITAFSISAYALALRGAENVYLKADLSAEGSEYDREKLLDQGFYNAESLAEATTGGSVPTV
ncbi:hypothetical protein QP168_09210 [Aerococcus urinae]|uniref:Phage tail protein n=1 Tax=Aerococcus mictus TaxID=2976810 RepID=A0A1E9PPN5_9LACT|nr:MULTISPECIES: hypothetical protein [Aerococcus]KAA9292919.1 phage tail protein [Aerococcus mictus]MBU5610444.1 hypothetical protein [Aerococcus urinae]MCY3064981.1 hypothetical protein [Aerococcus mictus]MCY3076232.1 hypothetical protein [Aerococcus mictus]MCY3081395.1 hypothetical protein [Aerococcus mictus]